MDLRASEDRSGGEPGRPDGAGEAGFDASRDADLQLLVRAGEAGLGELFAACRESLLRMVRLRMHPQLSGRLDAADVVQEAYLDAVQRLAGYLDRPAVPPRCWLRQVAGQTMINVHRRHLGARKRSAQQEVRLVQPVSPVTSASMAMQLAGQLTSPSQAAIRAELLALLEEALESMDPIDREVLFLRHFEELSNQETAELLGLQKAAASNRYIRALKRLRGLLDRTPGLGSVGSE